MSYKSLYKLFVMNNYSEFGISKRYLCKMMKKGRTRVTEYLVALKKNNLCTVERKGNHYFYKENLDNIK